MSRAAPPTGAHATGAHATGAHATGTAAPGGARAVWHRRTGALPLAYLAAIVVVGFAHPALPQWRWLAVHLLLLGAVTNAIVIWSAHFSAAVLRIPAPASRRGEAVRLAVLNAGVLAVLAGGTAGRPWLGAVGAVVVFGAICAHLAWLAARLRAALRPPLAVTVHYYLAAGVALLAGVPAGGWMLVSDAGHERLVLFHAHVNLLGWVTLTVLGTVLTLWPTILRTRMAGGAVAAARTALPVAVAGLALLAVGVLAWWPVLAAAGVAGVAAAAVLVARPAVRAARGKPPASFAAWSIAAAGGWLLVALGVDAATLLTAGGPGDAAGDFGRVLVPLLAGFAAQTLLGALSYLLPTVLGGGPVRVRAAIAAMERHWPQRVVMANLALAGFLLPVPPYVRITTSLLVLAALVQFLVPAVRLILQRRTSVPSPPDAPPSAPGGAPAGAPGGGPASGAPGAGSPAVPGGPPGPGTGATPPRRPLGGVAAGVALVLLAALAGAAAERATDPATAPAAVDVPATGNTTTVEVTAEGMRYHPDEIQVPAGDRLVIELTNADNRSHDLVLANGAETGRVAPGETVTLDAGVVGGTVEGWCSLPGHRQAGMTLTITATGAPAGQGQAEQPGQQPGQQPGHPGHPDGAAPGGEAALDPMAEPGPGFTARDATAPPASSQRVHRVEMRVQEVVREVAPGVEQTLWTFNGTAPGPVLRGQVGDVFEITLINDGSVDHGIDFHAGALAPDRPMRPIEPGERLTYRFTATKAGIWMYHCSTMPMLLHIGNGMYGAVIIDPPDLPAVDREYVLVQSEFYLGPDGEHGDLAAMRADRPDAVVFNGYAGQYHHQPLAAAAGERVRFWVLDAGPSRASAFHIVGAQFDTVYREGRYELTPGDPGGAQVLDLVPAAGGFVETVFPEAGTYPFVSHAMVDAERGARGAVKVEEARP